MTTILPPLSTIGKRRLLKLIAHLRTMPRQRFNFAVIKEETPCGTAACAIGECPRLFPKLVRWVRDRWTPETMWSIEVIKTGYQGFDNAAEALFGVKTHTASFLFHPYEQAEVHPSLPDCGRKSTPKQVARMLEKFIKLTETEGR